MFGNAGDSPLGQLQSVLGSVGVNSTTQWCSLCSNTVSRGCQLLGSGTGDRALSPAAAGAIGASVTLGLFAILLASLASLGVVSVRRRRPRSGSARPDVKTDDWIAFDQARCWRLWSSLIRQASTR